jgi:methyl-accepting chemotaxis protein
MWTFGRKIALGFALSFALLLVVGGLSYRGVDSLTATSYRATQSHDAVDQLHLLASALKDAETSQRGFMLTGIEAYLDPYQAALTELPQAQAELARLWAERPDQLRRLAAMAPLIERLMRLHQERIELRRQPGSEDAVARVVRAGEGKRQMDELRRLLEQTEAAERTELKQRAEEVEAAAGGVRRAIGVGTALSLVFVCVAGWLLTRALGSQIGSAVQHVQRSSAELQSAANQQATGARESATAMTEITTTITELLATSRQIADSAQRVAMIAEQTAGSARQGEGMLQSAHQSMAAMRDQIDLVVDHMLDLGRKSQQIGAVLDIVGELAEQTNILAINATIEATVAGDAGKRFGVIADEIRKLADRMTASTKEIRGQIDEVRSAVNSTVMATETGSKAVEAGTRLFGEVSNAIAQIAGLVQATTEAAREIELSTKQQTSAVEQVNIAIASTAQAARETEASSSQTLQTASQLAGMSRELLRLVHPQST